jgi:hypothetical protein
MRAVCTDLRGPVEKPALESCEGSVLKSFREQMRGWYHLLKQKPSSLFMLLGWSSISTASLTM